jgi:hypothetical protein
VQPPILLFILMLFVFSSQAKASELYFSFQQELQSFYLSPPNSSPYFGRTTLDTKGDLDIIKNLKFKLDSSTSNTFMNKQDQKSFLFNPTQLGLSFSSKYLELFGGGFTVSGDGADINNIFDVVNPQDFRQPFQTKSIGSVGVLATLPFDSFQFKAFYIPKNDRSRMPDTQSAWWPRTEALPITNSDGTFLAPENMSYKMRSESEHEKPFENNYGASAKLSFSNVDFSAFYFSGANQIPKLSPHFNIDLISLDPLVGVIQPPVEMSLTWFKSEHTGGGVTLLLSDWILKGFCKQQKDILPEVEKSTSCTTTIENSLVISNMSLRYFLQQNRKWKSSSSVQELETLLGFFDKSSALGIYLDMNSGGTLAGAIIYNEKDPSVLVSLGYEYRFTDHFKSKLTANVLTSSGNNVLAKAYDKTDNAVLTFAYDF